MNYFSQNQEQCYKGIGKEGKKKGWYERREGRREAEKKRGRGGRRKERVKEGRERRREVGNGRREGARKEVSPF